MICHFNTSCLLDKTRMGVSATYGRKSLFHCFMCETRLSMDPQTFLVGGEQDAAVGLILAVPRSRASQRLHRWWGCEYAASSRFRESYSPLAWASASNHQGGQSFALALVRWSCQPSLGVRILATSRPGRGSQLLGSPEVSGTAHSQDVSE